MFQHYTEKARRVIFYARYEASQYGSPYIDTEHILLGLLREDPPLMHGAFGPVDLATKIRAEFEKVVKRGNRISLSVEVPLTADSKKLLNFASEEANRRGQPHVGTEDLLLGILRLPDSLAAKLLIPKNAKVAAIREQIEKRSALIASNIQPATTSPPLAFLDSFLGALRGNDYNKPADFFDDEGQFVDSSGRRFVGCKQIEKEAESLFAVFAKKNSSFVLEDTTNGPSETIVASGIWQLASALADRSKSMLRMSIVLASTGEEWAIVLVQVTPILPGPKPAG
jgi:ketosteroid isomerase-like protein